MAPAKARNHDDHKSDAPAKEKGSGHASTKMRRGASQQANALNREAPTSAPSQIPAEPSAPTLAWSSFDRRFLHAYVREHELSTAYSYLSPYHNWVLSHPGSIGLHSPTMARKRKLRRQSRDQLALAVRKHFNGLGIQENEVIVDFIYKIRNEKGAKYPGARKAEYANGE
ncbi:hypothetical protein ESCO_003213 [Escovopsis weberi]|uniref:Histone deacetylase complex subunit SAP30 Sin3 binding domain-containing protein n=1 Tax=Escovopsis weberi TaxID=150374 RepID=A0A0M8MSJ4_ESCWE|nr:hypothetical protein ESCO_003213 [Escovopsis weberi]